MKYHPLLTCSWLTSSKLTFYLLLSGHACEQFWNISIVMYWAISEKECCWPGHSLRNKCLQRIDWRLSLGDLPSQIELSSTIWIQIPNLDDDFDTNPIPSRRMNRRLNRRLQFQLNFDLYLIKVDRFRSLFH